MWFKHDTNQHEIINNSTCFNDEYDLSVEKYLELKKKIEILEDEKEKNLLKLKKLEQTIQDADIKCTSHLNQLSELKNHVTNLKLKLEKKAEQYDQAMKQLSVEKLYQLKQEEKWETFQKDLLTTVKVANDLKTEAEELSQSLLLENKNLTEKINNLENELNSFKIFIDEKDENKISFSDSKKIFENSFDKNKENDEKKSIHKFNKYLSVDATNSIENIDFKQLLRQQSADSVFSTNQAQNTFNTLSKYINSSQSLKNVVLIDNFENKNDKSKKTQISVKTLVETIENASKSNNNFKSVLPNNNSIESLAKSPSINNYCANEQLKNSFFSNDNDLLYNKNNRLNPLKTESQNSTNQVLNNKSNKNNLIDKIKIVNNETTKKIDSNFKRDEKECIKDDKKYALKNLIKDEGSKRNALLKWCQKKTYNYDGIDITNFSSSWNDGLAFCALLNSYLPDKINFEKLDRKNKKNNFTVAFNAAKSVGIKPTLNIEDLINEERPDWNAIMAYVTSIYDHFENN